MEVGLTAMGEVDLLQIERLLREQEVALWWNDPPDIGELREYLSHDYVTAFCIVAASVTVGFAQVYHANCDPFWQSFGVPRETFGLDLAIGAADARNRGIGRVVLRLLTERLFMQPEVVRLQIDPDPENARAVRAFGAAGFAASGVHPGYDGDTMLYMTIER